MKQRGRPRHPDVLTPREWEVLSLIREALSNPEIGQRLGISADAAKYHVAQILSKLNVATREEAAAWQPEPTEAPVMRPAWARALGHWWPALAWVGAAAVLAGLALLVWGLLRSSDDGGSLVEGSRTPIPSGAATVSAPATGTPEATLSPMVIGEPVDIPNNLALITAVGCINCDGIPQELVRVYRAPDGSYVSNELIKPEQLGARSLLSWLIDPSARRMFLTACMSGSCGGIEPPASDAVLEAFESMDGGVTWQDRGRIAFDQLPAAFDGENVILVSRTDETPSPERPNSFHNVYETYPSGERVTPPNGDDTATPFNDDAGNLLWWTADGRILASDGRFTAGLPRLDPNGAVRLQSVLGDTKIGLLVGWVDLAIQNAPFHLTTISFVDGPTGSAAIVADRAFPQPYDPVASLSKDGMIVVNGYISTTPYQHWPSLTDESFSELHPMPHPFSDPDYPFANLNNGVVAIQRGPFARVTGTGSCLNIRAIPASDGQVVGCLADNVLLTDSAGVLSADGTQWRFVTMPSGITGWASMDFLEIDPSLPTHVPNEN